MTLQNTLKINDMTQTKANGIWGKKKSVLHFASYIKVTTYKLNSRLCTKHHLCLCGSFVLRYLFCPHQNKKALTGCFHKLTVFNLKAHSSFPVEAKVQLKTKPLKGPGEREKLTEQSLPKYCSDSF